MSAQTFRWQRHQYAVGHGFFHAATVTLEGLHTLPPFHYIYDCGAKKVRGLLAPAIDDFCETLEDRPIDLMILSHFHSDHISGLDILLARKEVRHVAIPYLADAERLLLIGRLLTRPEARFDEIKMAADPGGWLRGRGIDSVLTIQATDDVTTTQEDRVARPLDDGQSGWTLRSATAPPRPVRGDTQMGHRTPLRAFVKLTPALDFHFYCWQARTMQARITEAWDLGGSPTMAELLDPRCLASHLRSHKLRNRLIKCYRSLVNNALNWSTLCVLISPSDNALPKEYGICFGADRFLWPPVWTDGIGWLGTGDLELGQAAVYDEFCKHYKGAPSVAALSLPHHGSKHNFDARLISRFKPGLAFATVPPLSEKHPDQQVLRAIRQAGVEVHLVDGNTCNALHEETSFTV